MAIEPRAHEHALAVRHSLCPEDLGNDNVAASRKDERQCLVLDGTVGVADASDLAGITERQESPRSVQPVGVASVAVGNRDVQERPVIRLYTKRAALAVHRRDAVDVEAVLPEARGEDLRVGKPSGAPNTR